MAALVTSADVLAIIEAPASLTDLTTFITTADLIITEDLAGVGLSQARLTEIEKYLAAHFATIWLERGGLKQSQSGHYVAEQYNGNPDVQVGLAMTRYGQQAIALDKSGTLASIADAKPKKFAKFSTYKQTGCE